MKKILALMLIFSMLFVGIAGAQPAKSKEIEVFVDGVKVNLQVAPVIESGTTLVQFRPIFEQLGLKIEWNQVTKTITGTSEGKTIKLTIGSKKAVVSGKSVALQVAPKIINGNTMIPLRFIAEATSYKVNWDPKGIVTLTNLPTGIMEIDGITYNVVRWSEKIRVGVSDKIGQSDTDQQVYSVIVFNDSDTDDIEFERKTFYATTLLNPNRRESNGINDTLINEGKLYNRDTILKPGQSYQSLVVFSKYYKCDAIDFLGTMAIPMPSTLKKIKG